MYYPDLSTYEYETPRALLRVRNVGWLDGDHPFPKGPLPAGVVERLRWLRDLRSVRQMRGCHVCEICGVEWIRREDPLVILGSAEIWVPDGPRNYFSAPDLIIHYIEEHEYLPPQEFVDAVRVLDSRFDRDLDAESWQIVDEAREEEERTRLK